MLFVQYVLFTVYGFFWTITVRTKTRHLRARAALGHLVVWSAPWGQDWQVSGCRVWARNPWRPCIGSFVTRLARFVQMCLPRPVMRYQVLVSCWNHMRRQSVQWLVSHVELVVIINIYIDQLQLFGSKVILAATHEQALLFPWERGWAGGQFDLVKSVSRSIKKMDHTSLSNVFDDLFMEPKQEKQQQQQHHKNLEQFTQMISTPSNQSTGWVGWELFVLGSSIQYISPKWQLWELNNKGTKCWHHNWTIDPRIPTIPDRRLVNQLQLFGSKVILAATHEQALLFPWERGWAGGQFDLVKSVSRSIKKMDHTSLSNVFDDLFMEPKQEKQQQQQHHKNLEQFTQMISTHAVK